MMLSRPSPKNIESEADQILNPLFSDVEQALNKSNVSPAMGEQRSVSFKKRPLPATRSVNPNWDDPPMSSPPEDTTFWASDVPPFNEDYGEPPFWLQHLDKIIFTSSCFLLLWVLLLLQKEQQAPSFDLNLFQSATVQETPPKVEENQAEFISYMERALAEIKRQEALKAEAQELTRQLTPSVKISTAPATQAPANKQTATVEKPQPATPPKPQSTPQKTDISSLPALPPPPSNPPRPKPAPGETSAPPETTNNSSPSQQQSEDQPQQAPSPTPKQTLVGLLELGEHSAALLKVNGVTQRIMIGENLPDSNWKLTKISSNKATFKKGSQQKFMSVGESMSQK